MLNIQEVTSCISSPIQLAQSNEEIQKASLFRKQAYSRLYPQVTFKETDPFNQHAYVLYTQDIKGIINSTGSLIQDSEIGLPEDHLFPSQVYRYRQAGKKLMEIGRFVINDKQNLLKSYYKSAYDIAITQGIDILLMIIRHKDLPFHQKLLGAQLLKEDVGESFGSDYQFSCLAWNIENTHSRFLHWIEA